MNRARYPRKAVHAVFMLLICIAARADDSEGIIGIVLSVRGELVQTYGGTAAPVKPGGKVYKKSVIALAEGEKRGKVQVGLNSGPVVYTRFPVSFEKSAFDEINPELKDNYISCIGGTVLRSKGIENETKILEWYMPYLGAIGAGELKGGFSLAFGKTYRSDESLVIDPLYFKFRQGVSIQNASFAIVNKETEKTECEAASFEKQGGDYTVRLDQIVYGYGVEYAIVADFRLFDGTSEKVEITYYVYGDEEIAFIEEEVVGMFGEGTSDYEKALIRAGRYRYYEMNIKALLILKSIGIDLDGML
ncbi:MAG: hypothetical protein JW881_04805 [Spirochaetales bacterium]|nr:hypothetical protein [Spirochaetales bacterium]